MRRTPSALSSALRCWGAVRRITTSGVAGASAATTPPAAPKPPPESVQLTPRLATRNLLKASIDLARRSVDSPSGLEEAVEHALLDLQTPRRPVVAFYGDSRSGVKDIVTVLLEEPLSDDQAKRNALVGRHDQHPNMPSALHISPISHRLDAGEKGDHIKLDNPFLRETNAEILEVTDFEPSKSLPHLLSADHIILVTDNVRFLSQPHLGTLLQTFHSYPSVQIVLNRINTSTSVVEDEVTLSGELTSLFEANQNRLDQKSLAAMKIILVSSNDALDALDLFRNAQGVSTLPGAKATAMDLYQTRFQSSAIAALGSSIQAVLNTAQDAEDPYRIQSRTGAFLASHVLRVSQTSADRARLEVSSVSERIEDVRQGATGAVASNREELLGAPKAEVEAEITIVKESLENSRTHVLKTLESYKWWSLPWKVDTLGDEMRDVIGDEYGAELANKINYQSGRLSVVQEELSTEADHLIKLPPHSTLSSAILANTLAQLPPQRTINLSALLIQPLQHRKAQLLTQVVPQLEKRAQNSVIAFYATSLGSAAAGWVGAMADWITVDVGIGVGVFGIAAAVRLCLVGGWEKASNRFWANWTRIGEGLGRDIQGAYDGAVSKEVLRKTIVASDGLQQLVEKRLKDVNEVEEELKSLQRTSDSLQRRLS